MPNLPQNFRHVRLALARERAHPAGESDYGYDLVIPLAPDGTIDGNTFKEHKDACRVRKFRPGAADVIGKLVRGPGGRWGFDYDETSTSDDESAYRFGEEQFVQGEYVSVRDDGGDMHTFQVTLVEEI